MSRFILINAGAEAEVSAEDVLAYLQSDKAPVNATTGQARAAARLFARVSPVLRDLAEGKPEINADAVFEAVQGLLTITTADTVLTRALQSVGNWLLVGAGRVAEVD